MAEKINSMTGPSGDTTAVKANEIVNKSYHKLGSFFLAARNFGILFGAFLASSTIALFQLAAAALMAIPVIKILVVVLYAGWTCGYEGFTNRKAPENGWLHKQLKEFYKDDPKKADKYNQRIHNLSRGAKITVALLLIPITVLAIAFPPLANAMIATLLFAQCTKSLITLGGTIKQIIKPSNGMPRPSVKKFFLDTSEALFSTMAFAGSIMAAIPPVSILGYGLIFTGIVCDVAAKGAIKGIAKVGNKIVNLFNNDTKHGNTEHNKTQKPSLTQRLKKSISRVCVAGLIGLVTCGPAWAGATGLKTLTDHQISPVITNHTKEVKEKSSKRKSKSRDNNNKIEAQPEMTTIAQEKILVAEPKPAQEEKFTQVFYQEPNAGKTPYPVKPVMEQKNIKKQQPEELVDSDSTFIQSSALGY